MKKTLWILTLVLILIFSFPAKQKHIGIIESDYTNTNNILFKQHFKRDDDTRLSISRIDKEKRVKSDPNYRTRRKKGKIIFSNSVLLQSESKPDFKTKK